MRTSKVANVLSPHVSVQNATSQVIYLAMPSCWSCCDTHYPVLWTRDGTGSGFL